MLAIGDLAGSVQADARGQRVYDSHRQGLGGPTPGCCKPQFCMLHNIGNVFRTGGGDYAI